jgi:hypothetical protein
MLACIAAWTLVSGVMEASAASGSQSPAVPIFRLFLKDGTPLVSYGEYTRLADRVVFTVPLGSVLEPDSLQIVSLPLSALDWNKTAEYADVVRFQHYASTRGDADYKTLTAEVARAMTEIALTRDPARKLDVARRTRAMLVAWPRTHLGYRSTEVRDLALLLDETISAAQADLGQSSFSIDLVATLLPPPGTPLPAPSVAESIESARAVSRASDAPVERLALQQAILAVLARKGPELPAPWVSATRADVLTSSRRDLRESRAYGDLRADALRSAARHAERGDVAGVERVLAATRERDIKLGHRRADEVAALTATLESHLDAARQRRLELDRWQYRLAAHAPYRNGISSVTRRLDDVAKDIQAVRTMSGPRPARLPRLATRLGLAAQDLSRLVPPAGLLDGHAALLNAVALMSEAIRQREQAVHAADSQLAGNASAAAAGSLLLLDHSRATINAFFARPGRR